MGWFTDIRRSMRMSPAAAVAQQVLEPVAKMGMLNADPADLAAKLVASVWMDKPDIFDGKYGKPPHKLSVAAIALASGFDRFRDRPDMRAALAVAVAEILKEVDLRGGLYPFHNLDAELFRRATDALIKDDEERQARFGIG